MGKRIFTITMLLGLFLFGSSSPVLAGRCVDPSSTGYTANYHADSDSYIVIEGTISGLPSSYDYALPNYFIYNIFPEIPSSCKITGFVVEQRRGRNNYYCYYFLFKDTATKRECWEYFKNLNTLTLRPSSITVKRSSSEPPEHWTAQPSSRTVTLSPVRQE